MKYLLSFIAGILLTACGSKTYIQQRPVVVEKPIHHHHHHDVPVIVEHKETIERVK